MSLADKIDHTILRSDCSPQEIVQLCGEALEYGFPAVCIPPYYIQQAFNLLGEGPVKVATVIGFPMGYSSTPAKVEEIKRAIDEGAGELDVVINVAAVKDANWNYVKNDIDSATRAVHLKGKVVKIILETGLLNEEEIKRLCDICSEVQVDFVKTSTGFHGGAKVETVQMLRSLLDKSIRIKASGGIRTAQGALQLIEAGASRLGSSAGIQIIQSLQ